VQLIAYRIKFENMEHWVTHGRMRRAFYILCLVATVLSYNRVLGSSDTKPSDLVRLKNRFQASFYVIDPSV
jgi:hypothetical protein